ncbi:GIY-YIG nuclease family protein [Myroides odoratimimus]|uniref:GIY-YIG nuclease family protein n=1 Tax=Myroides odoratimimus TaxID=76832 RepID=UPI00257518EB|nr:GIY-YIG nuclease family protein [Myroides odoratimimus]MDM1093706.1 GIY-YIG nuclease family protein [Myroides odoratimimus]
MNQLTSEQLAFLKEQKIELKYVFNANGLKKKEYGKIMKDLNMIIAFNVTPCKAYGHSLRTRSGHCCQCDTSKIAFQLRADANGVTYLAGSLSGELIKIGYTKAVEIRSESLNRTQYANYSDWEILFAIESKFAGKIENLVNIELNKYFISNNYEHDNHNQQAYETFKCSYEKGKQMILEICQTNNLDFKIIKDKKTYNYNFKNLIKK